MRKMVKQAIVMNVLTNGHGYNLRKHWDDIVERIGSFVPASLRTIYGNLTVYHLVTYMVNYLPLILYTVNFIWNLYKESRKRVQMWEAEMKDVQLKLDLILCQEEEVKQEFRDREESSRRATEQYHRVRAQVRQLIARSDLHELKLPFDSTHLHLNRISEEEPKLLEELIKDSNYEKEDPLDENTFNKFYDRTDTVDTLNESTFDSKDGKGYTIKFVKVTNVYKMLYLQHHYKQKRLQRAKHANLNKKTNNIKILFNEWNNSLNAVTNKVYSVDSGMSTEEPIDDNLLHDEERNERVEERNESQDDVHIQNQCLAYGYYSDEDMVPESEIIAMDYTTKIFDNRRNYTWADQALPVLPEETSSEIKIQELDQNINIFDKI